MQIAILGISDYYLSLPITAPLAPAYAQGSSGFSTPSILSKEPGQASQPQIAVSGDNVYVVWATNDPENPQNSDMFFARSTDRGASFSQPVNISNTTGGSSQHQIAVSGDNVYVVWTEKLLSSNVFPSNNYDVFFARSTDRGASFSQPVAVSAQYDDYRPVIAVSGGNVYVAWMLDVNSNLSPVMYRSTDSGATFNRMDIEPTGAVSDGEVQIAVSGSKVYIVWENDFPDGTDVYAIASENNGNTFDGEFNISNTVSDERSTEQQIAASGENAFVAWAAGISGNYDTYLAWFTYSGGSYLLKDKINLSNNSGDTTIGGSIGSDLDVAASGDNVYVAWADNTPGNNDVFFAGGRISSGTLSTNLFPVTNLSNSAGNSMFPVIAASGESVYVAWQDDSGGKSDIFFSAIKIESGGIDVEPPTNLTNGEGFSFYPAIAASNDKVYVAWKDASIGDVLFSSMTRSVSPEENPPPAAAGSIEILSNVGYRDDPEFVSVVEARNNGTEPIAAKITVTYYDSNGNAVTTGSSSSLIDVIHPGQKAPFKVRVNVLPPAFSYFDVSASEATQAVAKSPMLKIISENSAIEDDGRVMKIVGEIQNTGSETSHSTKVVTSFYDDTGSSIVDASSVFTEPRDIAPNGKATFEVSQVILLQFIKNYTLTLESQEYTDFSAGERPFTLSSSFDGINYVVTWRSANVVPKGFTINPSESLQLELAGAGGELELTLPKNMIDGIHTVRAGEQQVPFQQVSFTSTSSTIMFNVPDNARSIEIIGATVVPEFPVSLAVISAIGLLGMLIASRWKSARTFLSDH